MYFLIALLMTFSSIALSNDKNNYTLWNATPDNMTRGLSTDRPDKTESPYTVDAGHFQVETDLINHTYNRDEIKGETITTETTYYNLINLKVGITNDMDLQVIPATYVEQKIRTPNESTTQRGFGDTVVRLKKNLHGNDSGDFALALLPFVKIPTAAADLGNRRVEGGIAFPFGFSLPNDWGMGTMLQVNNFRNDDNTGSQTQYSMTWTLNHSIVGNLNGFIELYNAVSDERDADQVATLDLGLTYLLTPKIQIDAGYFIGITEAADDYNTFLGLSALF